MTKKTRPNQYGAVPGKSRTADKFVVRLPDGMRQRIAEAAEPNKRSMNSEIIDRLEESLARDDGKMKWTPMMGTPVWHIHGGLFIIEGLKVISPNQLFAKLEGLEDWVGIDQLRKYEI